MIVIYNNHYIAGVCKDQSTLDNWTSKNPIPEDLQVKNINLSYPFYVMEESSIQRQRTYTFLQTLEDVEKYKKTHSQWACYTFEKDWLGTPKFEDYMGILNHEHSPEDDE